MPHDWYWPMWLFPMFMPIFWIVVIVIALFFIFGRGRSPRMICGPGTEPADILKKRYAKGGDHQRRIRADEAIYYELIWVI